MVRLISTVDLCELSDEHALSLIQLLLLKTAGFYGTVARLSLQSIPDDAITTTIQSTTQDEHNGDGNEPASKRERVSSNEEQWECTID